MRTRVLVWLVICAALGAVAWTTWTRPELESVGVVAELRGRWTTKSPRHADRFLEITGTEIVFGQGAEGVARHRILDVRRESVDGRGTVYVIHYSIDGDEMLLRIRSSPGRLRLDGQPGVVWKAAA
jgi:hypothetical protein